MVGARKVVVSRLGAAVVDGREMRAALGEGRGRGWGKANALKVLF